MPAQTDLDSPSVSVLMPVMNAEPHLSSAIESILTQTVEDFEFLIHDDGSTDGSLQTLRAYAARDPRIRVSHGPNQGLSKTLNALLRPARAPWIARMDADDVSEPHRFETQLAALRAEPQIAVLGSAGLMMDEAGRPLFVSGRPLRHDDIDAGNLRGACGFLHPAVIMSRARLMQVGGYNESWGAGQDLELWLRLAEVGEMRNLPDPLIRYRIHEDSVSAQRRQTQHDSSRRACEAAWARRGITGTFEGAHSEHVSDPLTQALSRGWRAWNSGYDDTWRHYAKAAVRAAPLSRQAWALRLAKLRNTRRAA